MNATFPLRLAYDSAVPRFITLFALVSLGIFCSTNCPAHLIGDPVHDGVAQYDSSVTPPTNGVFTVAGAGREKATNRAAVQISAPPAQVNRNVLLNAMKDSILDSAELKVVYDRSAVIGETQGGQRAQ